ncbi:hypothetical protein B0J11DRAFT_491417 [Dendryphion nanum]|uniref:Uncharacterized protein n=1 Tax=Dendryphion nanum TaxID=256645 RepID=A0A9P9DFD2_9PLEO|nr:hypothetical protein B0J11DRAFT_491417 [Dendryphion nanum]
MARLISLGFAIGPDRNINAISFDQVVEHVTETLADSICWTHQNYCIGKNQQYPNSEACKNFLTQAVRFGKAHELGQNTLLCRSVHEQMVQWRPAVHCSHIGPSGGGMCTDDQTYVNVVTQNHFTSLPFSDTKHAFPRTYEWAQYPWATKI